jgi:hypothetical protein
MDAVAARTVVPDWAGQIWLNAALALFIVTVASRNTVQPVFRTIILREIDRLKYQGQGRVVIFG